MDQILFDRAGSFEESIGVLKLFISNTCVEAFLAEEANIFGRNENFIITKKHLVEKIPQSNIKVEIFSKEEGVPHFRVSVAEYTANYSIHDCSRIIGELPKPYHRKVLYWYRSGRIRQILIDTWNEVRPDGCQVGKYKEK